MAVRFHNRCPPVEILRIAQTSMANSHAGKRKGGSSHKYDCVMVFLAIIVEREGSRLDHDLRRKAFTVSWLTFIRFTIPLLLMSCGKCHCGLTGTGSHRTMGPLLRLGHDNFAYHCGPGRDARLDHDHPQKGLHCVGLMFMRFAMALLVRPCSRYSNTSCSRRV